MKFEQLDAQAVRIRFMKLADRIPGNSGNRIARPGTQIIREPKLCNFVNPIKEAKNKANHNWRANVYLGRWKFLKWRVFDSKLDKGAPRDAKMQFARIAPPLTALATRICLFSFACAVYT